MVRVVRPTSRGWPWPFITIGTTAASQHSIRSDSGATGPPKSRHAGPGPVLQVLEPDQHVHVRAVPAALRHVDRGRARSRTHRPAPRPAAAPVPRSSSPVSGLAWASITAAIASNIAGVVEPALELPAAVGQPGQEQLVGPGGWAVVGFFAVLVEQLDQRLAPVVQLGRGVVGRPPGELGFRARPLLRAQPPGRLAAQQPGDHLDVPQTRPAPREHLRGRRQPGRQHRCRPAPIRGATCSAAVTRRWASNVLPAEQVAQRPRRGLVAALGEHPVAVQPGDRGHRDLVQPAAPRSRTAVSTDTRSSGAPASATPRSASTACANRRCAAASGLSVTHTFSRAPPTKSGPSPADGKDSFRNSPPAASVKISTNEQCEEYTAKPPWPQRSFM